jgi:hypothetical protein
MRAFLHGFGCYAVIVIVAMWVKATEQQFELGLAVILSVVAIPVAPVMFRLARKCDSNASWLHAIGVWLLGFGSGYVVFAGCIFAFEVIHSAIFL